MEYNVHVFFPRDEDIPDTTDRPTIYVSKAIHWCEPKMSVSHTHKTITFTDRCGRELTIARAYMDSRGVQTRPDSYQTTGWYERYEMTSCHEKIELEGEKVTLYELSTGNPKECLVLNSECGPKFLFHYSPDASIEFMNHWHCFHPGVYQYRCDLVGKQEKYLNGYERFLYPVPEELKRKCVVV